MAKRITVIQGHPDPEGKHFGHALADAYAKGGAEAGHEIRRIAVAALDFPILRRKEEWETGLPPQAIQQSQEAIRWADHLVIVYPLWGGSMPALLKAFFEQTFRPGFALSRTEPGKMPKRLLTGKTARIVVTMGMPALVYRWFFRAHSLKSLERNILAFSGIGRIKASLIGMVEAGDDSERQAWIAKMHALGRAGR
jgi:putative NADPH-quinone reductase